ncbi:MAG: GyrI-like domain-containing protein [Clostridia bacterium]|nr:GyrI-like domain-containing protein [Clostridia bacterium]
MNVRYERKEALTFIGYHTEIPPQEGYQKCPAFWKKEYAQKYARLWQTMTPENEAERAILDNGIGRYALCVDGEDSFTYWIAGLYQGGPVPAGLELFSFPAGEWAMFTAKGPIPEALQALNTAVWQEWFPGEGKLRHADGTATVEVYSNMDPRSADYESGIWMPLKGVSDYVAYCGLDCESCEARLATVNGDEALRRKVAEEWSRLNGVEITPEMIHCVGCRIDGVKTPYCDSLCPIRQCALQQGVETCGGCGEMDSCPKLAMIVVNNADARRRLEQAR